MNRLTKLALAAGLPLAVLAGVGQQASAATPTTTPPADATAATLPAGWQVLVDDTGLLTAPVPPEWTEIDTVPGANPDGSPRPWLQASPSIAGFNESFDTPGLLYVALPATADLEGALADVGVTECGGGSTSTQPYDDGAFAGTLTTLIGCGESGSSAYYMVAANNPANPAVTVVLHIGITSPADQPIVETILNTFNFTPPPANQGGSVAPTTQPVVTPTLAPATVPTVPTTGPLPGSSVVPTVPPTVAPATTVAGTSTSPMVAPDAVPTVDDTGLLTIALPAGWTQVGTEPAELAGASRPTIAAAPDMQAFLEGFTAPGVIYSAYAYQPDLTIFPNGFEGCTYEGTEQYNDGLFVGELHRLGNCGGTATRIISVNASPVDQTMTVRLLIQLTDANDTDLNTILGSFNYNPTVLASTTLAPYNPN